MRYVDYYVKVPPNPAPADALVTVDGFIDHARLNAITVGREPDLIQRELDAAVNRAESYLRRSLLTQTLVALYEPDGRDCSCAGKLKLPRGRVQSVMGVSVGGEDLTTDDWTWDGWATVTLAAPATGSTQVTWISGYGDTRGTVPALIVEGIYRHATTLYENRTGQSSAKYQADAGRTLPAGVVDCWRPYQIEISG